MGGKYNLKAGERRVATILFSDMKGFTALSERLDPEEIDSLMNLVFSKFESIIKKNGGMVEKYIGDALVAVFGVPDIHEDDPSRAVHSAMEFLSEIKILNQGLKTRSLRLSFRTGIHSGLIMTGKRGEFEVVTGHAMSVAQRLQAEAGEDMVSVSETVAEACGSEFKLAKPEELSLKGKSRPVKAFRVLGPAKGDFREAGPFIGRKECLEDILRDYMRNSYEEVSGYFLLGDPGIGKTRLAQAFIDKLRRFPDFETPVLVARAQKYQSKKFSLIIEILIEYLGVDASSPSLLREAMERSFPEAQPELREKFIRIASEDAEGQADSASILVLFTLLEAVLARHSRDLFPILVFIDGADYMDGESRDFFRYFLKRGKVKPFFLLAAREAGQGLREVFPGLKSQRLPALSSAESAEFVKAYWPEERNEKLVETILASSQGNPLFLKEYIAYAKKNRTASSLPASVQNIFLTSLERYAPEARELLKKLSAFVLSFTEDDARYLEERTEGSPERVSEALGLLVSEGILARDGDYRYFRLDIFKKALYASLLNHNKKILHGIIADRMGSYKNPNTFRLIHHLIRAERFSAAVETMQADPNKHYNPDYLPQIDTLLKRMKRNDYASTTRLLIAKSAILFNSGKIEDAESVLKQILRIAVARRNDKCMGFAYHWLCAYNTMSNSFQNAHSTGMKALHYYRKSGEAARGIQDVLKILSINSLLKNESEESERFLEEMRAQPGIDPNELNEALAEKLLLSGDYADAFVRIGMSLGSLAEEDSVRLFFSYGLAMNILWQLCDFKSLVPVIQALIKLGSLSASLLSQANAMLAAASRFTGGEGIAQDLFSQAEFFADRIRNDFDKVDALRTLALAYFISGDERKAETAALEGLALGLRHSCHYASFTLLILLVEIHYGRKRLDEARFYLGEASLTRMTGVLLPDKDLILYHYYAGKLLEGENGEENFSKAKALLDREKSRIGKTDSLAIFLSLRSFGKIEKELGGLPSAALGENPYG